MVPEFISTAWWIDSHGVGVQERQQIKERTSAPCSFPDAWKAPQKGPSCPSSRVEFKGSMTEIYYFLRQSLDQVTEWEGGGRYGNRRGPRGCGIGEQGHRRQTTVHKLGDDTGQEVNTHWLIDWLINPDISHLHPETRHKVLTVCLMWELVVIIFQLKPNKLMLSSSTLLASKFSQPQ